MFPYYAECRDNAALLWNQLESGYGAMNGVITILPCKPVIVLVESLNAQYEYLILESPLTIMFEV